MPDHLRGDGVAFACTRERSGRCRICELIDPASPDYREDYRRLFHPHEFPDQPPAPRSAIPTRPVLDIPLAGDVVEAIAKRIGADRLTRLWERWTGQPCGCAERREKLNRATERLVRWLNSGTTRTNIVRDPRSSRDSGR